MEGSDDILLYCVSMEFCTVRSPVLVPVCSSPEAGKRSALTQKLRLQGHSFTPTQMRLLISKSSARAFKAATLHQRHLEGFFFPAVKAQVTNRIQFSVYFSCFYFFIGKQHFILFVYGYFSKFLKFF